MNDPIPAPPTLPFAVNTLVLFRGEPWRFVGLAAKDKAIIHSLDRVPPLEVDPRELTRLELPDVDISRLRPFSEYPEKHREEAERRFGVIDKLLRDGLSPANLKSSAEYLGLSIQTLNKLVLWYVYADGRKAILIPRVFRFGVANHRLHPGVESIITEAIERHHLTDKRPPFRVVMNFVERECAKRDFKVPSEESVRDRLLRLPPSVVMLHQQGLKAAREKFEPLLLRRPDSTHPMSKIEIDHTRLNLFAVDQDGRKRRPWITVAIDDFSRAILGFYITFDEPGWLSVALCMYRVLTPKEGWLRDFGLTTSWPCWGNPHTIQTDSAYEFTGTEMERVSLERNWVVQQRLLAQPKYGGRIERLMGAAAFAMELLPGKSFRSVTQKGDYDSESFAVISQDDLERYLLTFFAVYYNNRPHRSLGKRSPLNRWLEGMRLLGDATQIQPPPDQGLLMSLLPSITRTVTREGVSWETVTYNDYAIARYIRRRNPEAADGKYRFHYHPADVRFLYFRHPGTQDWIRLRAQNLGGGPLSVWERDDRAREDRAAAKDQSAEAESNRGLSMMVDQADLHTQVSLKQARRSRKKVKGQSTRAAESRTTPREPLQPQVTSPVGPRRMTLVPTDPSAFATLPVEIDPSLWDDIPEYKGRIL
ncbi:MAG: Mu transposase C-terminal domain-containing protein [Holophagaceae bacterium]